MTFANRLPVKAELPSATLARTPQWGERPVAHACSCATNKNTACGCTISSQAGPPAAAWNQVATGFDFSRVPIHARDANSDGGPSPSDVELPGPPAAGAEPADAPAKQECPAANQAIKLTGCIQPVVIADDDGKNPTTAPSFDQVQSIWKKCCIDYSVKGATTVKKSAYKTLDESPDNNPTQEEKDLFKDAGASTCVQVFVPTQLTMGGETGKNVNGGGGTYERGTANPKVVLVEGAVGEVVAHEVGHASGFAGHVGAGETVMKATGAYNVANPTTVSTAVCSRARTGAVLTKAGDAKDCCMDPK